MAAAFATVDEAGGIEVGPQSAGADPGPVCYDRGGTLPTVTDANLLLGYLNAQALVGGELPLNFEQGARIRSAGSAVSSSSMRPRRRTAYT